MRKMKKINGYLVVRFNDRERRDYGTLGTYGVIDAELYTGHMDVDRGALEYDDAETLEQAIEQARGLESELDVEEPETAVTVIVETDSGSTELETTPEELIRGEKHFLETCGQPDRPRLGRAEADWHFRGYVRALADLGIVDSADERFHVPPKPPESEYLADLARMYARVHQESRKVLAAMTGGGVKEGFRHLPPGVAGNPLVKPIYKLGQRLETDCPDNDCVIYRNVFRMALELEDAMDGMDPDSHPARTLRKELMKLVSDLRELYSKNVAVRRYRGACPLDDTMWRQVQDLGGTLAAAEQEAAVTATILAALRQAKEAEPEKGHPVREYLLLFLGFCAAAGGGALAGLGLSLIAHRLAVPLTAVLAALAALTLGFMLWKRRG